MIKIQKAGAIILNKNNDSILLLYGGNKYDWSFPKGHIEEGEKRFRCYDKRN